MTTEKTAAISAVDTDPLLAPFVREQDSERADILLSSLIRTYAEPVVDRIVRRTLPGGPISQNDYEDIKSEVLISLLDALSKFKQNPSRSRFNNFLGYVAVTAYNTCYSHLRLKHPKRWRLKNQVRYALNHTQEFGIWESESGEQLCGFDEWRASNDRCSSSSIAKLRLEPDLLGVPITRHQQWKPAQLLTALFRYCGAPVELDDLVDALAQLLGVSDRDAAVGPPCKDECDLFETLASSDPLQSDLIESRLALDLLWNEIRSLPKNQIRALLLGLRDKQGLDAVSLLGNAGVASLRDIAEALRLDPSDVVRMWDELPMSDLKIAELLGVSRQQVINLRKSARERLAYRIEPFRTSRR